MKKNIAKRQSKSNAPSIVKVRLMGTAPDIEEYFEGLQQNQDWKIDSQSEVLDLRNSQKFKRKYIDFKKNDTKEDK